MKHKTAKQLGSVVVLVIAAGLSLWLGDGADQPADDETGHAFSNSTGNSDRSSVTPSVAEFEAGAGGSELRRESSLYGGLPISDARVKILDNPGFTVGFSEQRQQPLWVAYEARPIRRRGGPERPRFEVDHRTDAKVHHRDYSGTGYTRGHLAPNFVISRLYGRDAQLAAFLMSNISPQREDFNAGTWQRLEELEIDEWADEFSELVVVTGPVFAARPRELRSGIPIPQAFFRVLLDLERGEPRAIAFLIPHDAPPDAPLGDYVTTIDAIERETGLDLFAALDDELEAEFEAKPADARWNIGALGRRPGRYQ